MATIKVSDSKGTRFLNCFDTLSNVPYVEDIETPEDLLPDFDISQDEQIE